MPSRAKAHQASPSTTAKQPIERLSAHERGYTARWRKARCVYLAANPLCAECFKDGRLIEATVVDHIVPHRGNDALFWDEGNWRALCKRHHDRKTATEDGGFGRQAKGA